MTSEALIRTMKTYLETGEGDAIARRLLREALSLVEEGEKK